ncbi:MAG TPA: hypothetical protein VJJ52_00840 [Candidatus Nanoarchaeia archaeon]|nr:hypothetical protein [Candidatus Nanoarchaeia archaeon]
MGNSLCIRFSSNVVFSSYFSEKEDSPSGLHNSLDGKNQNSTPLPSVASRLATLKICGIFEARGYNTDYTQFFLGLTNGLGHTHDGATNFKFYKMESPRMCTINRNIYIVCAHTILCGLHRNNKAEQ